jgi:hypothetical protein
MGSLSPIFSIWITGTDYLERHLQSFRGRLHLRRITLDDGRAELRLIGPAIQQPQDLSFLGRVERAHDHPTPVPGRTHRVRDDVDAKVEHLVGAVDYRVGGRVELPRALLDPGLAQVYVDVLAFAGPLLPDRSFGHRIGGQDDGRGRSGLHDRLPHRLLAGKGDLPAAVLDGEAGVAQDVVGDLSQVFVVVHCLLCYHCSSPFVMP